MRRHILPFLAGFLVASVVFAFGVLPRYGREKLQLGHKQGEIATKFELLQRVPEVLGEDYHRGSDGYKTFFGVKAGAVVVVERNGVKTLRTYVPGP
jgi:hypothetical protein